MLTFGGEQVTHLIVIAEICGKDMTSTTVLKKMYFREGHELGKNVSNPHPDRVTDLVNYQHDLLTRNGYVVEEENEQISTNGENHWSLTRWYKFAGVVV